MAETATPYRVETALERGIEGRGLAREDALSLMEEGPLEPLLATAAAVRDRFKGRSVSYSRKVFIPLTHLCRDYCGYCTFRADPTSRRRNPTCCRTKFWQWPKRAAARDAKRLCSAWATSLSESSPRPRSF